LSFRLNALFDPYEIFRGFRAHSMDISDVFLSNAQVYQYIIMWAKAHDLLVIKKEGRILLAVGPAESAAPVI
jgi:hypothetical protein